MFKVWGVFRIIVGGVYLQPLLLMMFPPTVLVLGMNMLSTFHTKLCVINSIAELMYEIDIVMCLY